MSEPAGLPGDLLRAHAAAVRAAKEWHAPEGRDVSLFEGVSLARLYRTYIALPLIRLFRQAAKGLDPSDPAFMLDDLGAKYEPAEELRLRLRREDWKARAFRLLACALPASPSKRRVLVLASSGNRPLWRRWLEEPGLAPGLTLDFLLENPPAARDAFLSLSRGSRPLSPPRVELTPAQERRLEEISAALSSLPRTAWGRDLLAWEGRDLSARFAEQALEPLLRNLRVLALKALAWPRLVDAQPPSLVLLPQEISPDALLLRRACRERGIPVWFLNHGYPAGGYRFEENLIAGDLDVDAVLAWGPGDAANYRAAGLPPEAVVEAGNPAFDDLLPALPAAPHRPVEGAAVLALNYARPFGMASYLDDGEEKGFLGVASLLDRMGAARVLFKLHPGRPRMDYYRRLGRKLQVRCEVSFFQREPLASLLRLADMVVGPASTAIFESVLAGKDYYLYHFDPCPVPPPFEPSRPFVARDLESLEKHLAAGESVPRRLVLEDFLGLKGGEARGHGSRTVLKLLYEGAKGR